MKKTLLACAGILAAAAVSLALVASAQTGAGANAGSAGTGYASPGYVVPPTGAISSSPTIYPAPVPVPPPMPPVNSGFIQFNDLIIESVSGTNPPAEILATNQAVYPVPMMGSSGGASPAATCYKYETESSAAATAIACPVPPTSAMPNTASGAAGGSAPAPGGNVASPTVIAPSPAYPIRYQPYRIEIDASTMLSLRDRTPATLADFAAGDTINVFGYYNADGTIQAYLVRDLSRPAETQYIQLNNVTLVSASTSTTPATLVVTQAQGYPCYGYGATGGSAPQDIACPMGVESPSTNAATKGIAVPPAVAPMWQALRKYVIQVDAQTVVLDSNRTRLPLSDLQVGDSLNVYGATTDNGQTVAADIIRDLSIPPTPQTYSGTVTQVNADGSFVLRTNDGRTITVASPVQTGASLSVTGILDRLSGVLSQVSNIMSGNDGRPVPMGTTIIKGGATLPPGPGGTPNTQN